MAKEKGSKKTGGRTKGTPNKATSRFKDTMILFTNRIVSTGELDKIWAELSAKDRIVFVKDMAKYFMETKQEVEHSGEVKQKVSMEPITIKIVKDK